MKVFCVNILKIEKQFSLMDYIIFMSAQYDAPNTD